jgi:hypothetical protein
MGETILDWKEQLEQISGIAANAASFALSLDELERARIG